MSIIIDVTPVNLSMERVEKIAYSYIEFTDTFILRHMKFDASRRDDEESLEWKSVRKYYAYTMKRESLIGVDLYWNDAESIWCVRLIMHGTTDWELYFYEFDDCKKLYDIAFEYIYGIESKGYLIGRSKKE